MVELLMGFGLGFFATSLLWLTLLPKVHARAERLTERRLKAELPVSIAAIRADKDFMRAEFALTARQLELTIEQLRAKMAMQLAELGRKTNELNRLKSELATMSQRRRRKPAFQGRGWRDQEGGARTTRSHDNGKPDAA